MTRQVDEIVALDPDATYEAAEVAMILFHISLRTFGRRLRNLRRNGFPPPLPGGGRKVWNGQALIDWKNRPPVAAAGNVFQLRLLADSARLAARKGAKQAR